jgi:hypothetical protein
VRGNRRPQSNSKRPHGCQAPLQSIVGWCRPSSDISNSKFVAEKQTLVKRPVTVSVHGGPEAVAANVRG